MEFGLLGFDSVVIKNVSRTAINSPIYKWFEMKVSKKCLANRNFAEGSPSMHKNSKLFSVCFYFHSGDRASYLSG